MSRSLSEKSEAMLIAEVRAVPAETCGPRLYLHLQACMRLVAFYPACYVCFHREDLCLSPQKHFRVFPRQVPGKVRSGFSGCLLSLAGKRDELPGMNTRREAVRNYCFPPDVILCSRGCAELFFSSSPMVCPLLGLLSLLKRSSAVT